MPSITSNLTTFTNYKAGNMSVGAAANWYWTTPSNAQTDDNNYAKFEWHDPNQLPTFAVGQSDVLDARQIVTTVPSGATINGIEVTIRAFNSLNGTFDVNDTVNLLKGGSIVAHPATAPTYVWSLNETVQTYGGATDLWGTTWTDTDVNGSGFGVSTMLYISLTSGGEPPTNPSIATVDQIYVTVYYTGGSSGTAVTILPSSITIIGEPKNITIKSVTNIITSSIRNPTLPKPSVKSITNLSPTGFRAILPNNLTSIKSVTGIRVTGLKTLDFTGPRIASSVGIRLSSIRSYDVINNTNLLPVAIIRPSGLSINQPNNNHRILASTFINPNNFTRNFVPSLSIPASTIIFPSGLSSAYNSLQRIQSSTIIYPPAIKEIRSVSTANILSAINVNVVGVSNIATVSSFKLTNRFYDTFQTNGTINFGDTADLTYNTIPGNYSRTTTAGSKVVAYQCIFDKGDDFYVQGLVKTDDGYTTSGLSGIGFGIQPSNKNYGYFAVVDVRNGTGGNTTHSLQLRKVDALGTTILVSYNATGLITANTWYRIYAYWNNTTGITVFFNEKEGTPIGVSLNSTDSTFTSGYDGFTSFSNSSFDNLTNIPRQYVDINDGGIKQLYNIGFPFITQGLSIQPSGLSIASLNNATIRTGNANINLAGLNFNRLGTTSLIAKNDIFPRNFTNITPLTGVAIKSVTNIIPSDFTRLQIGRSNILSSIIIRPTSFTRLFSPSVRLTSSINILPGTINAGAIGNITFKAATNILPAGFRITQITGVSSLSLSNAITPQGLPIRNIGVPAIKSLINILPNGLLSNFPITNILINRQEKIIPNGFNNSRIGIVTLVINTNIRPSGFALPRFGNITVLVGNANIRPIGLYEANIGSIFIGGDNNVKPIGINIRNFGNVQILGSQRTIIPSSIKIASVITLNLQVNTNIAPVSIRSLGIPNATIIAKTNITPSGIKLFDRITLSIAANTLLTPTGIRNYPLGSFRIISNTNIIPRNFISIQPLIGVQIRSSSIIYPSSVTELTRVPTTLRLTGGTLIIPPGLPMPIISNLHRMLSSAVIIPYSIAIKNTITGISIKANISINIASIANVSSFGNIRLTNRFYDTFKTDGTINFGDTADLTYNAVPGNYSRSTTAGTKVVAYQCIFDKGDDFYVQGLVKSDDGYTTSSLAGIGFGIQPSNKNYGYFAVVDVRNGTGGNTTHSLQLRKVDASGTTVLASHNASELIKANTFYRIYAYWNNTTGITVYFNEKEGTPIGVSLNSADSTFTSGYDGFTSFSNASFDNLTNIPRQYVDITDGGIKSPSELGLPAITQGSSSIRPSSISIDKIGTVTLAGKIAITPSSIGNLTKIGTISILTGVATIFPNSVFLPRHLGFTTILGGGGIQPSGLPAPSLGSVTILAGGRVISPSGMNISRIGNIIIKVNVNIIPNSIRINRYDIGNITIQSRTMILPSGLPRLDFGNVTLSKGGVNITPVGLPIQKIGNITILSSTVVRPGNFSNIVPPVGIIIKSITAIQPNSIRIRAEIRNITILSSTTIQPRNFTNIQGPKNISIASLAVIRPGSIVLGNILGTITVIKGQGLIRPNSISINSGLTGIRILASTVILPNGIKTYDVPGTIILKILATIRPTSISSLTAIGQITILSSTIIYPRQIPNVDIGNIRLLGGSKTIQPGSIDITKPPINIIINVATAIRPGSIRAIAGLNNITLLTFKNIIPSSIVLPPNTIGTVTIKSSTVIRPGSITVTDPSFGSVTIKSSIIIYPGPIRLNINNTGVISFYKSSIILPGLINLPQPASNIIIGSKIIIYPSSIRSVDTFRFFPYFAYNPLAGIPIYIYAYGLNEPTTPFFYNVGNVRIAAETKISPASIQNSIKHQIGSVIIKSITTILPSSLNNYEVTNLHLVRAGTILIRPASVVIRPTTGAVTILSGIIIRPSSITLGNTNAIGQIIFTISTKILPPGIEIYEVPRIHLIKPGPVVIYPYTIRYTDTVSNVTVRALNTIIVRPIPENHRIGDIVIKSVTAIIPKSIYYFRIGRHKILMSTTPGSIFSYYELVESIDDDIEVVELEQVFEEFDSSIESDIN
jgi:hypothetical protein